MRSRRIAECVVLKTPVFRNAAQVVDYRQREVPRSDSYFQHGHSATTQNPRVWLWVWDGELKVALTNMSAVGYQPLKTHEDFWPGSRTNQYRGRMDEDSGVLTVSVPERLQQRDLPDTLVRALETRFPDVKKIQLYG
jgi:hypothetical protein